MTTGETDANLIARKKAIELRLKTHGIEGYQISYLPYLNFEPNSFTQPRDVAYRIMILLAVTNAVHYEADRPLIVDWLKRENIWPHVSPEEVLLFEGKVVDKRKLAGLSWSIETAYVLAWSLGLVSTISESCSPMSDNQYDQFSANVPLVGEPLQESFLSNLSYIDKSTIIDENLFNELVTTYFRDAYFGGKKNLTNINPTVSFERHKALNWLRRFMEIEDWDETDTST